MTKPLQSRQHPRSSSEEQLHFLDDFFSRKYQADLFGEKLKISGGHPLTPAKPEILQVNIGYQCNQTCAHCHVDAGPDRKEMMSRETMESCLDALRKYPFDTLDITGGAPEMHQDFRWFIREARQTGVREIIVRSNLTIIVANPKFYDLPDFFAAHRLRVCSSLPFYQSSRTDRQRGEGVFDKSVRALKMLNEAGYGVADTGLVLDLVYNPSGAFMPGDQLALEADFKKNLKEKFDISFNQLLAITNVPISRFLDYLLASGNFESYFDKLISSFNPATVSGLMCRNTVSVDWQGYLYDCDFNQMLNLKMTLPRPHITSFDPRGSVARAIVTGPHCFACTAGAGSGCQGNTI